MTLSTDTVRVEGTDVEVLVEDGQITELMQCPFCDGMDVRTRQDWGFKCGDCGEHFDASR
jgi:tRNA(Ile2) C34 agmatinyltransferase TiaS